MSCFFTLFGIKPGHIRKNCILLPLLRPQILEKLKIEKLNRGKLFAAASSANLSIVVSGLGPALAGDAVLYLKDTPCKNIILFGSCGLVKEKPGLTIGSLVAPFKSYSYESFTQLLLGKNKHPEVSFPEKGLFQRMLTCGKNYSLKEFSCATVSSLKLEDKLRRAFIRAKVDVVDMECSAFFSACRHTALCGAALFYATDVIKQKPFYRKLDFDARLNLAQAIEKATDLLIAIFK